MRTRTRRRGDRKAGLAALVGGGLALLLTWELSGRSASALAAALSFLLGAAAAGGPVLLAARLQASIEEARRQLTALINIRPLLGALPVPLDRWSIDPHFADVLVGLIAAERPRLVVECGSGSSTVVIAAALRHLGCGHVLSLDHVARFADRSRELLRQHGLEQWATVVHAPLEPRELDDGRRLQWYAPSYEDALRGRERIDLLVIDGPPRRTSALARYPAVPVLGPYLSDRCIVVMDDGNRPDEREIAARWERELRAARTYIEGGRGIWILRKERE